MSNSTVDTRDNHEIILEELQTYGGWQKQAGEWTMVCCPFHDDSSPSMGVLTSLLNPERLGFVNCLGCGARGSWNFFAEKAGLQLIEEWKSNLVHDFGLVDRSVEEDLLGVASLSVKGVLSKMSVPEAQPWPTHLEWSGFSGKIVRKAGGYIAYDTYNDSIQLIFIVKYAGQVRGGVKAMFTRTKKGQTAYVSMKGPWVNTYGLLFFEQAQTILQRTGYSFVIIVEGPRDALRLLCLGIPAVAVLGAATMSTSKAMMLTALAVDTIYVMPDNDAGGDTLWRGAKKALRNILKPKLIALPKTDDDGNAIKIDPGNMSEDLVDDLLDMLEQKQGFIRR